METQFNRPDIFFNGKNSKEVNLRVLKAPLLIISNEKIEYVPIEGRRGQYTIKTGTYDNKVIPVTFTLIDFEKYNTTIEKLTDWFNEITDNRLIIGDRDKCYRVINCEIGDIEQELVGVGDFTVLFHCESFLTYVEEATKDITNITEFYYLGNIESEPLWEIWGSGNIQLTINDDTVQIKNVNGYVAIDTKYMHCHNSDGSDKELDMIGDYPMLKKGKNTVAKVGTITKIIINCRTVFKN